ncbi:MAG: hypothetical protein CVV24_14445 [Ignavibacteriae bacterium HGW-Ignavibacteriae-3]|nr:MAG: hypothetical protein CVV24_14445 [Ignavibacteriae bacterium HGW-Ignavibacteriae-3]
MYQFIAFAFIIIPAVYLGRTLYKRGVKIKSIYDAFFNGLKIEFKAIRNFTLANLMDQLFHLRRILYFLTVILASILILTGFIPVILLGKHIFGIFLLIHVLVAPFFCITTALLILLFANQHTFLMKDYEISSLELYQKISFWVFAFFSIPAILSVALSLFPIFGTDGLGNLLLLHQISVLFLTLSLILHSYFLIISITENNTVKIL